MNLLNRGILSLGLGFLSRPALTTAQDIPKYDVSTVKVHNPENHTMSWSSSENGFLAIDVRLKYLIADAWKVRPDQLAGEPSWVDDSRWDVAGKSTDLSPEQMKGMPENQQNQMMQQLLGERFHLRVHLESRTGNLFALKPAKGGLKLKPVIVSAEQIKAGTVPTANLSLMGGETVTIQAKNIPLAQLIANLAANLQQTIVDKTGLPPDSIYDFSLHWNSDNNGQSSNTDALTLPEALEDQLGLHLESTRGQVQVLVVDRVEKPTAD